MTKCHTFTAGEWEQSHILAMRRDKHLSWQSPNGILLLGGEPPAGQKSELLSTSSDTTTISFDLPYRTVYVFFSLPYDINPFLLSLACSIELVDSVVVTGGVGDAYRVQVYNIDGAQEQLPSLSSPRVRHACGHFVDSANRLVST